MAKRSAKVDEGGMKGPLVPQVRSQQEEREARLVVIPQLLKMRLTFRAMADALAANYPDLVPVGHTTIARDVNILIERFRVNSKAVAAKYFLADLQTLDDDERKIEQIIMQMKESLVPVKDGLPDNKAVAAFSQLYDRKLRILEYRNKLLGLDAIVKEVSLSGGTGGGAITDKERIDGIMALVDRARTRRDASVSPELAG